MKFAPSYEALIVKGDKSFLVKVKTLLIGIASFWVKSKALPGLLSEPIQSILISCG